MATATLTRPQFVPSRFSPHYSGGMFAEYFAPSSRKLVVDRASSTVAGVKLMGAESRNRRRFSAEAMRNVFELSAAARINVNHNSKDIGGPREYADRFGSVLSRTLEPTGIFGTVLINAKHPLAEQFFWDAENAPHHCGFSPVYAPGKTSRAADGFLLVESITRVASIDLVADPATTRGLAECLSESLTGETQDFSPVKFAEGLRGVRQGLLSEDGCGVFAAGLTGRRYFGESEKAKQTEREAAKTAKSAELKTFAKSLRGR